MITNKNEAKTMIKHISCDCKCKFDSTTCNSNQEWSNETFHCECKNYCTRTCENSKYLKSISDTSEIECDEIISAVDIVSIKKTNTIATNVTKNCHSRKKMYKFDCYILHTVLLGIMLLLIITIICYHYAKHISKQKGINTLTI